MKKIFLLAILGIASLFTVVNASNTTVPFDGDLAQVLSNAESGDTLLVQAGTFIGNFTMKDGVQVSGGWDETFSTQTQYGTILDAQGNGRVLNQETAFETPTYWENLTIQNGSSETALSDKGGFGVHLQGNGGLRNCLVQNNMFTGTSGESQGGGVRVDGADATFVALENCIIKGNKGTHAGGVLLSKGTMTNCIVEENTTTNNAAGGVTVQDGSFLLNSIIRYNTPKGDFGGVRVRATTSCTVANCLIYGNKADGGKTVGGLGINDAAVHYVYNNTIVGNIQTSTSNTSRCGLRVNVSTASVIANNIVWGNKVNDMVQAKQVEFKNDYKEGQAANFINNAVVLAKTFGTNTMLLTDVDPGFVNAAEADYTLAPNSSLIDAGADAYAQGNFDLAGKARIQGFHVDLGCYEATPGQPTALKNIKTATKVYKVMENGQMVVVKDNARYNVLGVKL